MRWRSSFSGTRSTAPENVGFSHNVEARTARRGDRLVVEAITRVQSVDLVADPATTRGLFEAQTIGRAAMTLADLKRDHPELVAAIAQEQAAEIRRLEKEVARLTEAESLHRKRETARQLLRRFHLPEGEAGDSEAAAIVGPRFIESLLAAADEEAMRRIGRGAGAAGARRSAATPDVASRFRAISISPRTPRPWTPAAFAEAITW